MDPTVVGRVLQTTTSAGTGPFVLDGVPPRRHVPFAERYADGETMYVVIEARDAGTAPADAAKWQTGTARYVAGPDRLTLIEVDDGSAGPGVAVSFGPGVKDVWSDAPGKLFNRLIRAPVMSYGAEVKGPATIPAGGAAAVHGSGVGVILALAADDTRVAVGLARESAAPGFAATIQTHGPLTLADWTVATGAGSLAPKATYFLDPVTPGRLTTTRPTTAGQVLQVLGVAVAPDTLDIDPGTPILL